MKNAVARSALLAFTSLLSTHQAMAMSQLVPPSTAIFTQPPVDGIETNFYYWPQSPLPEGKFYLTQNFPSPLGADSPYGNSLGVFSGFNPSDPLTAQMTINPNWWGGTTLQGEGNTAGIVINSDSNLCTQTSNTCTQTQWPTLFPVVASYDFNTSPPIKPWATDPNAGLIYSIDIQVPNASATDNPNAQGHDSAAYATGNFIIQDTTTGVGFWYGASFYDHRGASQSYEYTHLDNWNHGTGAPVVAAVVEEPGQITSTSNEFTTPVFGSNGFQSTTWTGYRHVAFAISGQNLLNAINAIRKAYPETQSSFTTNIANYEVLHTNFNPELYYNGAFAFIATSFQNYQVTVASSLPLPLYRLYNSKINRHLYTTSASEVTGDLKSGWVLDGGGNAGQLYNDQPSGTSLIPLYRLHRASDGDNFYTTSQVEAEAAVAHDGYAYVNNGEGKPVAGYLPNANGCSVSLYRLSSAGGHFYTISEVEAHAVGTPEAIYCMIP